MQRHPHSSIECVGDRVHDYAIMNPEGLDVTEAAKRRAGDREVGLNLSVR
jgi:hypothetical protein